MERIRFLIGSAPFGLHKILCRIWSELKCLEPLLAKQGRVMEDQADRYALLDNLRESCLLKLIICGPAICLLGRDWNMMNMWEVFE
jgi:hypothetical protein